MAALRLLPLLTMACAPWGAESLVQFEDRHAELSEDDYDPLRMYEKQALFEATACRDSDGSAKGAAAFVDQLLERGCQVIGQEEKLRAPPRVGSKCYSESVACEDAAKLANVSGLELKHKNAGEVFREKSGGFAKKWVGKPLSRAELFISSGQPQDLDASFYRSWRSLAAIEERIDHIVESFQEELAEHGQTLTKGTLSPATHEGRHIKTVTLRGALWREGDKRLLITSQMHAREWIAGMSSMMMLEKFIQKALVSPSWLARLEVAFVPIVNPDGFVYSCSQDRYWRKNSPTRKVQPNNRNCGGVDLNRQWAEYYNNGESGSNSPCSEAYVGKEPMREPEVIALDSFIQERNVTVSIDVHSFAAMILAPWAGTNEHPPQHEEISRLGDIFQRGMNKNSPMQYQFGPASMLYLASGVFMDHLAAKGALSYTVEIRPHRPGINGYEGFSPPPGMIAPVGGELTQAVFGVVADMQRH